jgi:SAM-dependent methyltransferase
MSLGKRLSIVTPLHESTSRDCLARMNDNKVEAMLVAKKYGPEYWDGNRRYGYGGYRYLPGHWKQVAESFIQRYQLNNSSKVLDAGCGKAFLLFELQLLLPGAHLVGFDISEYGLAEKHPEFQGELLIHEAQNPLPFQDNEFDLVISLGLLHNLRLPELAIAIPEIERVGRQKYVLTESYRNEQEMFNLECWALTAESLLDDDEWRWLLTQHGYTGDFELIYF